MLISRFHGLPALAAPVHSGGNGKRKLALDQ
jgi:hypothetical protein